MKAAGAVGTGLIAPGGRTSLRHGPSMVESPTDVLTVDAFAEVLLEVDALTGAMALLGLLLTMGFVGLAAVTMGRSVGGRRSDRIREEARARVRGQLLERIETGRTDWDRWIAQLEYIERRELQAVLERYLRLVRGSQREVFQEVAAALELGERADAALDSDDEVARLQAIATLTVLSDPIGLDRLLETCTGDRDSREAAARLLYERREEFEAPAEWGTRLLLWEGDEPLTVWGLQTLAALNSHGSTPLLAQAGSYAPSMRRALLIQVCRVLSQCQTVEEPAAFEWLSELLEHEEPAVREAAVRAFTRQGWRRELRDLFEPAARIGDPDPRVRRATYEVLTTWGDRRSREMLEWAVVGEPDRHCQLAAIRGLVALEPEADRDQPGWPSETWAWVRADLEATEGNAFRPPERVEVVS